MEDHPTARGVDKTLTIHKPTVLTVTRILRSLAPIALERTLDTTEDILEQTAVRILRFLRGISIDQVEQAATGTMQTVRTVAQMPDTAREPQRIWDLQTAKRALDLRRLTRPHLQNVETVRPQEIQALIPDRACAVNVRD